MGMSADAAAEVIRVFRGGIWIVDKLCGSETFLIIDWVAVFFAVMGRFPLYAVARGQRPGLYSSWEDYEAQVKGFSGAIHAGMHSIEEANEFFHRHGMAPVCALLNPTYPEIQPQRSDEDNIPPPILTNAPPISEQSTAPLIM
ncbi:hypothetical protein QJS10_CPB22g00219 [Acorus calamus]|uniref:Ribonuclease H1 N-terminal domain-containing protein n=1 Tax=Acorus calamus TaxID=4465 RepID=A0AAV9C146_ACOCL|nr:hypothetical protein QJS10_CPB22g00219 [Acorus calamus]